jgi:DNA segregation ATPase FtsK/SpoIIIE, S-DNA-T family
VVLNKIKSNSAGKKGASKEVQEEYLENSANNKRLKGEEMPTVKEVMADPRFIQFLGLSLLLLSLFVFLSFVSFWFNFFGKSYDYALVTDGSWKIFSTEQEVYPYNFMGLFGAYVSHFMVYKLFGLSAFIFPVLMANFGLKLFRGKGFASFSFLTKLTVFLLLWGSSFLAYISMTDYFGPGGGFGFVMVTWLQQLMGVIGTLFFLLVSGLAFGLFYFRLPFFLRFFPSLATAAPASEKTVSPVSTTDPIPTDEDDFESETAPTLSPQETHIEDDSFVITLAKGEEEDKPVEADDDMKLITIDTPPTIMPPPPFPLSPPTTPIVDADTLVLEINTSSAEADPMDDAESKPQTHIGIDEPYDPRLDLPSYRFPLDTLLKEYDVSKSEINTDELQNSKNMIVDTLKNYQIGIKEIKATIGPTVTLYEIIPESGIRISKIKSLEDDIALSLAALGIRIIAPIPGKGTIGIEVPNKNPEMVPMSSVIKSKKFRDCSFELPVILGKTISNELYIADLSKMPHLLVAGATGQGKSVGLNCLIVSLLYKKHPTELKFVLIDPKKVELSLYNKLKNHFLAKLPGDGEAIITDTNQVKDTLNSLCIEMDNRYDMLKEAGCRNIIEYNQKFTSRRLNPEKGHMFLPYIVTIIDEVADLMMTAGREVETPIARLAQLARAVGIHVILATQRPSVNIITGTIKANFPARIAFRVSAKIDSRTILDNNGADQLIGKGDMLFYSGNELIRLQCPFIDTPEADAVVDFIGDQRSLGGPFLLPDVPSENGDGPGSFDMSDRDELFEEAARILVETQQGSTSMIQRKLKIGFNRAGRLIDQLEAAGIVGPAKGSKAREVLFSDLNGLEQYLREIHF